MKLIKDMRGDTALLTLKGDFDSFVCNPFIHQIERLMDEAVLHIILNLHRVKFISSTGAGSIIKCQKILQEREGELILSSPSRFVNEVWTGLGLDEVIAIFPNDEAALAHFNAGDGIEMSGDNNVMIHPAKPEGVALVGRTRKLEEHGIVFETAGVKSVLGAGSEVRLKFRLPLYRKSHYFDIIAEITEAVHTTGDITFTARFTHMSDDDQKSIAQFVKDMQFLRREANSSE